MAIVLYRKGDSHVVRGVACEASRFEVSSLKNALAAGWVVDPSQIDKAPTKEKADTNNSGKLSVDEVRAAAKEAGIEGYDKKRIKTLKAELGYEED